MHVPVGGTARRRLLHLEAGQAAAASPGALRVAAEGQLFAALAALLGEQTRRQAAALGALCAGPIPCVTPKMARLATIESEIW